MWNLEYENSRRKYGGAKFVTGRYEKKEREVDMLTSSRFTNFRF